MAYPGADCLHWLFGPFQEAPWQPLSRSTPAFRRSDRAAIAQGLSKVLADTYLLYLKTHNFHWNVEGPMFQTLHTMFMQQYTEAWNAIDLVAERIRSLGHYAPGTYKEYLKLGSIQETEGVPRRSRW